MIGFAVRALMGLGLSNARARSFAPIALALAFAVALVIGTLIWLAVHDAGVIDAHEAKLDQRAAPARDKAADQRARDTVTIHERERQYHDAIDNSGADGPPAPAGIALGCERLRAARVPLPAECGPSSGN